MHGVHPSPNATPATGAAIGPKRSRCGWNRNSWYIRGVVSSCDPARYAAIRRTRPPEMRVKVSWFWNSVSLMAVVASPRSTKTTVNPSTNNPVVTAILRSVVARASSISPRVSPETRLRYPGTIGRTHGDRNEMIPPPNAMST